MKSKLDNLVCNAYMTFLDTPAVKGCSDLVFKTSGIYTIHQMNESWTFVSRPVRVVRVVPVVDLSIHFKSS